MFTEEEARVNCYLKDMRWLRERGFSIQEAIEILKTIALFSMCQEIKDVADVLDVGFQRIADKMAEQ